MKKFLSFSLCILVLTASLLTACGGGSGSSGGGSSAAKAPENAVTTISSDGDIRILVATDGRKLVVSENGWHPTLGSGEGRALTFRRVGGEQYALLDESTGMGIDVYENKTGVEGTLVAMYTLDTSAPGMKFTPVKNASKGTFSFKTVDGLYLSYVDGATDMTLSTTPMEFYLVPANK